MKHFEHPQLIKRTDGEPLSSLRTRDSYEILFECRLCGKYCEKKYSAFLQMKDKLCENCSKDKKREKSRQRMKERWKSDSYRKEISKKVSNGQKRSWKDKDRIKPQKEKYYWEIKRLLEEENYKLLTDLENYLYSDAYIKYKCPEEHEGTTTYKRWKNGCDRCKECKKQTEEERLYKSAKLTGFEIIEIKSSTVVIECRNGHKSEILKYNLYKLQGCGQCDFEGRSSNEEKIISDFLDEYNVQYIENTRKVIPPYEVDFFLPEYNLAIEYNGYPFHTEMYGKDKNSHRVKTILCEKNNIQLIHIFHDELLFEKEKVFERLKHILNLNSYRIYARNCNVSEISSAQARDFCENVHLQDYQTSSVRLGLFYQGELVSVMTFRRYNKDRNDYWELVRFASEYSVVGGASKLLNYFINNFSWKKIITYADRRWSQGNLYSKLGFKFTKYTKPDYFYINTKSSDKKREHRFNYRKSRIEHLGEGSEDEIMKSIGYTKIWGVGHLRYELENPLYCSL